MYQDDSGDWIRDGRQHHIVRTVTPAYVRMGGARGYQRVRYTSCQPIRDPANDEVVGYLCAAGNLNQILIVEAGDQPDERRVNPYSNVGVGGGTTGATWAQWAWLYDHDVTDGDYVSNEPLQFENIKHAEYRRYGDSIYLTVTAGRYAGRSGFVYCNDPDCLRAFSADDYNPGDECPEAGCAGTLRRDHHMGAAGPGVYEFRIDVSDLGDPSTWRLVGTSSPDQPHWYFVRRYETPEANVRQDYLGPMTTIDAGGRTYNKRWYPVCASRLRSGRHLIVNSLSQIESATSRNIGDRSAVLGAHVFEITTSQAGDDDPHNDGQQLNSERSVPAPGEMWAEPFTQPAYAELR
jgi:hypothetical protein